MSDEQPSSKFPLFSNSFLEPPLFGNGAPSLFGQSQPNAGGSSLFSGAPGTGGGLMFG